MCARELPAEPLVCESVSAEWIAARQARSEGRLLDGESGKRCDVRIATGYDEFRALGLQDLQEAIAEPRSGLLGFR